MINFSICVVTSPRIYKSSLCGALLRTVTLYSYCRINLCGLLFTCPRPLQGTAHHFHHNLTSQVQGIVLDGGQNVTSQLAELQEFLS